jgi:hypothetical protein
MNPLYESLKKDIRDLYQKGLIESARKLNKNLGGEKWFAELRLPMYFSGDPYALCVFVMLNPGAANDFNNLKLKEGESIDQYIERYIYEHQYYGILDKDRMDNFDLKQAAFLYSFKNSGIDLPNFFNKKDKRTMLQAKENVLMLKLQLELIPYCSREFVKLFDNTKLALNNIEYIYSHIERVLDILCAKDREYILFGSKQYYYIFEALKQKKVYKIHTGAPVSWQIDALKNKVSFNTVSIEHKGKLIQAGIPYSFPRRDLPNALYVVKQKCTNC